jgi:hypothetical protein
MKRTITEKAKDGCTITVTIESNNMVAFFKLLKMLKIKK